ncbi:MAG: hypothetical protein LJE69_07255 [Thiohalocapsa sp.]|uniref:hypothetical protein n=1 Tax=Thiohalocapsa sp. TaxID=2497641 RepID=UPI0025FCDC71|nr:hypothetical protein [Thiohalocapsa sp.]MCG6941032.1 hypothetical protein [Thiohalocapsa sp.]
MLRLYVEAASPQGVEQDIAMLDQMHDLRELACRPYNLRLIQAQVDRLEARQRTGERVAVANLSRSVAGRYRSERRAVNTAAPDPPTARQ